MMPASAPESCSNRLRGTRPGILLAVCAALLCPLVATAAAPTPAARVAASQPDTNQGSGHGAGTTIMSGSESPIGLFIAPWKNSFTEPGLFAPRKHRMQITPEVVNADTFKRQVVYYNTITAYRAQQRGVKVPDNTAHQTLGTKSSNPEAAP